MTKHKPNGIARQYMVRVPYATWQQMESQAKTMRKQLGVNVSMAEFLRKCISLGMAQLERGK